MWNTPRESTREGKRGPIVFLMSTLTCRHQPVFDEAQARLLGPDRFVRQIALALLACSAALPGMALASGAAPQRSPAATASASWPKTIESALGIGLPLAVTPGASARARRFLQRVRVGHRLFPLRRKGNKRRWLTHQQRGYVAKLQFSNRLRRAQFGTVANRRVVRGVYSELARYAQVVFKLPASSAPGVALLRFGAAEIPGCLANGGVFLSEQSLAQFRRAARSWQRATSQLQFLNRLLRDVLWAVNLEKRPVEANVPCDPLVARVARAMVAATLAHEMSHSIQNIAFSAPFKDWRARERRNREKEADVAGIWLAACAGYPLQLLLIDHIAQGLMDAVARSQGVREKPYPPWEKRVPAVFDAVERIRRLHRRGQWPKQCAPLSKVTKQQFDRRTVLRWLKQLCTPAGLRAALARKAPKPAA